MPSGNDSHGGDFEFDFTILPGDLDRDNEVAFADFLRLSTHFGEMMVELFDGDIDLDGVVTFADFLHLSTVFGHSYRS